MQNTLAKLDENQLCGGVEQAYMLYLFSVMAIIDIDIACIRILDWAIFRKKRNRFSAETDISSRSNAWIMSSLLFVLKFLFKFYIHLRYGNGK